MSIPTTGLETLAQVDPELSALVAAEYKRQVRGLELIASENFTSRAVMECLGSCLTNKYSEGLPGARYYGGNEVIDQVENLCRARCLRAFRLAEETWGVNVQPYSGSPANMAVLTAVLQPHERLMGLDLPSGGHLTHGYYTDKRKISASSIFFESMPYRVAPETGLVDYDQLARDAALFRPKLLICGGSAYPRDWDYARLRTIADAVGALLMCDMAHFSGLVATEQVANPFAFCDIVTTTTHKSLRGPRAGVIFFRRDSPRGVDLEARINFAVFPSLQGGPHNHQVAAIATQMREVATPAFREYSARVVANARALGAALVERGYTFVTGGTDTHLLLWDLRPLGLTGSKLELLCDQVGITLNKNAVNGDKSALAPGGVRVGSPALTSRGLTAEHFGGEVAGFLHRAVQITLAAQTAAGSKGMPEFRNVLATDETIRAQIHALKVDVEAFAVQFPMPGVVPPEVASAATE